jgi:sugar-specific transcriptional regulator TrmB
MSPDEYEFICVLMQLGLTRLQAVLYLNLAKLRLADVKTISKASGVTKQGVYRVMPQLEELGLAHKIVLTHTVYLATPLAEGSNLLLEKERQKIIASHEKAIKLLHAYTERKIANE